jgi:hypothetical protein
MASEGAKEKKHHPHQVMTQKEVAVLGTVAMFMK